MSDKNFNNQPNKATKTIGKVYSKNQKWFAILAVIILVTLIATVAYSLFSDKKKDDTNASVGKIEVQLKEDWPNPGDTVGDGGSAETYDQFGIKKYTKKIWGESTGDLDAYVRVRCIPIVEYYVEETTEPAEGEAPQTIGKWITAPVSQDNIVLAFNSSNENDEDMWIRSGEYWYYKNVLPAGENTAPISVDWQVAYIPPEIALCPIRTDVRVILEYSQTTHDMWKDIFQIDALPEGVEVVE